MKAGVSRHASEAFSDGERCPFRPHSEVMRLPQRGGGAPRERKCRCAFVHPWKAWRKLWVAPLCKPLAELQVADFVH